VSNESEKKPEGMTIPGMRIGDGAHLKIPAVPTPSDDIHSGSHPKVPQPFTPTGEDKPKK
jgi:hypothetical protein